MMRVGFLCAVVLQAVCGQRTFQLITTKLSWSDARDFCRTNYEDLADIENLVELASLVTMVNLGSAWIGLYYDSNASSLRWSTGATYSWMPTISSLSAGKCAMLRMLMPLPSSDTCSVKKAFICMYYRGAPKTSTVLPVSAKLPVSTSRALEPTPPNYILILDGTFEVTSIAPVIERGGTTDQPEEILASPPGDSTAGPGGGNTLAPSSEGTTLTTRALIVEETVPEMHGTIGRIEPITTNSFQDTKGAGYLVLKVDFVSFVPKDPERMKTMLLATVQELLEGRLSKDLFWLKWVGYEQPS